MRMKKCILTGTAGFIGSHIAERLMGEGYDVAGLDNFCDFYDPAIKRNNIRNIIGNSGCPGRFELYEGDICDRDFLNDTFSCVTSADDETCLVHLSAMAGVRPSMSNPSIYESVNVGGTLNLLEACRRFGVRCVVMASSSSVYGKTGKIPFAEEDSTDFPLSVYACTKKSAELMTRVYSENFGMNIVCLRYFTVFGPRQRPDLAIHKFARQIRAGDPVHIYGDGSFSRDYTYVDDIVQGTVLALNYCRSLPAGGWDLFNLGRGAGIALNDMLSILERLLGKRADRIYEEPQDGDLPHTLSDISKARRILGYNPRIDLKTGIARFVSWFEENC